MAGSTIQLSPELTSKIEARIAETEFDSPEEYVLFILEEVVDESDPSPSGEVRDGERKLEDRLRNLGYL